MGQGNISIRVSFTITNQEFGSRMLEGNYGHTRQKADSSLPVWEGLMRWLYLLQIVQINGDILREE